MLCENTTQKAMKKSEPDDQERSLCECMRARLKEQQHYMRAFTRSMYAFYLPLGRLPHIYVAQHFSKARRTPGCALLFKGGGKKTPFFFLFLCVVIVKTPPLL